MSSVHTDDRLAPPNGKATSAAREGGLPTGEPHSSELAKILPFAALAELVGTFILVFAITATAVSAGLNLPIAGSADGSLAIVLANGLTLVALVSALGHVSGAHLNPAVTLGLAAARRFPLRAVPTYLVAQFAGATSAALATWAIYGSAGRSRAGLGATAVGSGVGVGTAFLVEALATSSWSSSSCPSRRTIASPRARATSPSGSR